MGHIFRHRPVQSNTRIPLTEAPRWGAALVPSRYLPEPWGQTMDSPAMVLVGEPGPLFGRSSQPASHRGVGRLKASASGGQSGILGGAWWQWVHTGLGGPVVFPGGPLPGQLTGNTRTEPTVETN